jgi:hypothetical protein
MVGLHGQRMKSSYQETMENQTLISFDTSSYSTLASTPPTYESMLNVQITIAPRKKTRIKQNKDSTISTRRCGVCYTTDNVKYILNKERRKWFENNDYNVKKNGHLCMNCYRKYVLTAIFIDL